MEPTIFSREVDHLVELLRVHGSRGYEACGPGEETVVDNAMDDPSAGPDADSSVVTLSRSGSATSVLLRSLEQEMRLEVQTVPQSETAIVQAKPRLGVLEWVWGGRAFDTEGLAEELAKLWSKSS